MKQFIILIIFFCHGFYIHAQCLELRTAYEDYFQNNLLTLDPIEGFWSVTFNSKLYLNGELISNNSKPQDSEWAIIKDGTSFHACHKYGGFPYDSEIDFISTSNSNIYLYQKTMDGDIIKANATMTDVGVLEYSYETSQKELKKIFENKYKNGLREFREFKWIKTYPTQINIQSKQKRSGTGFAISDKGFIVTCNHVIENADKIFVRGINSDFDKIYKAKIILSDKNNDIAIIQIDDLTFKSTGPIPFILAEKTIDVGSSVFTLGYPLRSSMGDEIKVTNGIISSKSGFKGDITSYQISAPVQPGNSGGPLFDYNGNIVGIINAKNTLAENASYAIKTNYLKDLLESLTPSLKLNDINKLLKKSLSEKIKILRNYIYIIEIN